MHWHCVLRLKDLEIVYSGTQIAQAIAAIGEGKHWADGPTTSEAIIRAAKEVTQVQRGLRVARTAALPAEVQEAMNRG